jgi:hypothetical protein
MNFPRLSPIDNLTEPKVRVRVTLRLALYRQSVLLAVKSLDTHDQRTFLQLILCDNSPYVTSSFMKR